MKKLAVLFGAVAFASPVNAAVIDRIPQSDGSDIIVITGVVEDNDDVKFKQIAAATRQAIVLLNSEGGSVVPALEIGRAIRLRGFATAVASDALCASACALAWLAGTPRLAGERANIGFHASYVVNNGSTSVSGVANALIGAYLNQLGLSENAIVFVTSAPPEGMAWLSGQQANELGLKVLALQMPAASTEAEDTQTAPEPYDPMKTVAAFYNALSNADGSAAAALVIPEKRGIGPFNESSIHTFFGGLKIPLALESVSRKSSDKVVASYSYTRSNGSKCKGRAEVSTTYKFGKTLIGKIRALNGC
ncbi:hypothetical protein [Mesorhizobium sp. M0586]|uniref:hypothetical protein n=1 Tax=unclassified Mesorhizobium TaxID=325217 RepID=UPI0033362CF1